VVNITKTLIGLDCTYRMPLTQPDREHAGAVDVTRREEDTVEAEWAEEAEEGVDL
jgi:hypothetical protein